ncbi:MAG: hypothetical protein CMF58_00630 [Lentimicrobiaceae bacterium]|jgi:polyhydroxybutyrate depolymerase|nr:hypothetical protein [Lentimicrobiaceae bacterium]MDG1901760.1 alpha/beta hydrolase-fold protein [Bacteroidales bacterium]MDG2081318.1 alpha/beta hydrolase-fold protein [Bacteroidales bacterium]|tara:strand:- start:3234 stop:4121 length:888 start_codon:yes stop_codon:yes gene_type:complete
MHTNNKSITYFCFVKQWILILFVIPIIAEAQIDSIKSSDIQRTFNLQLPNNYNEQRSFPLIFVLHGYYHENLGMPIYSGFDKFVNKDCIVVYPHGMIEENGINYFWNSGGGLSNNYGGIDDVKFIDNLIDTLTFDYSIDTDSIFIVGHSNGGMMSYRLAMELSHRITAMANLAGSMMFDTIIPGFPVPILHIHGTADQAVLINGSSNLSWPTMNINSVLKQWAIWNDCLPEPDTLVNNDSVIYVKWSDKSGENQVLGCFLINQGHDWAIISDNGWNISENIWDFFTLKGLKGYEN